MNMKRFIPWCLILSAPFFSSANATPVLAGYDYFESLRGSSFDLGGAVGIVQLIGVPIDPVNLGTTDTIVKRLEDALVFQPGDFDIIDIEMKALSLRSASPISIGGNLFNVIAGLNPLIPSIGQMLINHENPDDQNLDLAEGTFDSMMALFLEIDFLDVNGVNANDFSITYDNLKIGSVGSCWSHTMTGKPSFLDESNFFITKCPSNLGVGITTDVYLHGGVVVDNPLTHHFPGHALPPIGPGKTKVVLPPFGVIVEDTTGLSHCVRQARLKRRDEAFCFPQDVAELGESVIVVSEPPILFLLIPALLGLFASRKLAAARQWR